MSSQEKVYIVFVPAYFFRNIWLYRIGENYGNFLLFINVVKI